jgi:hypothetical protein
MNARRGRVELPLRAVTPISRSQWNDGFGSDSGPSRGDSCRRAIRPIEALTGAILNGSNTLIVLKNSNFRFDHNSGDR